ncbi:Arginase, catabolizes arginine to ornithine and urea [Apophysomyces ossiformis]|uniref:Arginase n=1 Tax=Apophysomyces ossiformis TaxID=679940 RepID=A0A8H7BPZ3_9FUNG|nr:Arginase, catabolizes arginine to ornithine and urea [Apophysomyces ossiformis]
MPEEFKLLRSRTVSIVGVPFSGGQPRGGVEAGPAKLIEFGLANQLEEMGWQVEYQDNQEEIARLRPASDPIVENLKNPKYVSAVTEAMAKQIADKAKEGKFVLTLGGDHSVALATVSGIFSQYPNACLIWVDAHADINTPATTDSGNIHGCPLSFLTGIASHPDFAWVKACLPTDRLVYIGLRDVDEGEKKIIKDLGIKAFSMHHVDKYGIGAVVDMALDHVNPNRDLPIHLSFDVDALDPSVAPSTGTPVRGGLTFREGHYICEALAETGLLVAADVMEVNPALLDEQSVFRTVEVGCSVARCCLGESLL